jgi:hypothetical protein
MASGDKYGERIGLWRMTVDSEEKLRQYWNRITRFYRFPLQLEQGTLPPGTYILKAQLIGPTGEKMFDEYEFENESGATPAKHPQGAPQKENKPKSGTSHPKKK